MSFTIIFLLLYAHASYQLDQQIELLQTNCSVIEKKLFTTTAQVEILEEQTQSLCDPAADEYALITEFGMIPDGYKKIVFSKKRV